MNTKVLFAAVLSCLALTAARAEVCSSITNEVVKVDAGNDEWTEAVKLKSGDVILVLANGTVTFPHMVVHVTTGAKGYSVDSSGGLEMKVGSGTVIHTGERWVGAFRDPGTVKFRVIGANKGGGHNNMTGGYDVRVIVIPAGALPPTVKVESD